MITIFTDHVELLNWWENEKNYWRYKNFEENLRSWQQKNEIVHGYKPSHDYNPWLELPKISSLFLFPFLFPHPGIRHRDLRLLEKRTISFSSCFPNFSYRVFCVWLPQNVLLQARKLLYGNQDHTSDIGIILSVWRYYPLDIEILNFRSWV